jgi:hypothetical protein
VDEFLLSLIGVVIKHRLKQWLMYHAAEDRKSDHMPCSFVLPTLHSRYNSEAVKNDMDLVLVAIDFNSALLFFSF